MGCFCGKVGAMRIILADDHKIVREGLRTLLEKEADMEVVGEAANGRRAVQLSLELNPDMVIIDVSMPDLNGIEATRQIIRDRPEIKILALSMHSDKRFVSGILRVGASGYLLKDCAFEELTGAIRAVANGGTYLSPGVTGALIHDYVRRVGRKRGGLPATVDPQGKGGAPIVGRRQSHQADSQPI